MARRAGRGNSGSDHCEQDRVARMRFFIAHAVLLCLFAALWAFNRPFSFDWVVGIVLESVAVLLGLVALALKKKSQVYDYSEGDW